MKTCEFCGKEETFPHVCSYCGKTLCSLHMLPENHECSSLPKDSPFWTLKKERDERQTLRGVTHDICPKCHSEFVGVPSFDENYVNYVCHACWHRWTEPRDKFRPFEVKTFDSKEARKEMEKEARKSRKKRHWFS